MPIRSTPPKLHFNNTINELSYDRYEVGTNEHLYTIEDKSQSVCGIEIVFKGGKIDEATPGASFFSSNLLKSGIEGYNSNKINDFFELRGAFVQFQSGLDYNSFSLYCLSDKLSETLPFFLKLFSEPLFPQDQLDKLIKKKEQELDINEQKSNYWATKLLKSALFGDHPYGLLLNKNELNSITTKELHNHWINNSLNNIQFITAVGNFDLNQVLNNLNSFIENQKNKSSQQNNPSVLKPNTGSFKRKNLNNSQQSSLKIGIPTIRLNDNNYQSLSLANTLFGGYFGSRLMQSIREDKGLTYGISSSIIHLSYASYLQISADIKINAGEEVIDLIKVEINKIINESIAESELNKVKSYLVGEYKSNSETIFDKISKVKFLKLHNLADSFYTNHFNSILKLESSQIQRSLQEHIKPPLFNTVLVE